MINSATLGDVKFKLEFTFPLFSIVIHCFFHTSVHGSWKPCQLRVTGCNEDCCMQISREKRLDFFGLFFRGKAKELQDIESGYYKNVKLRLLQPNPNFTLREKDRRGQSYCLNFNAFFFCYRKQKNVGCSNAYLHATTTAQKIFLFFLNDLIILESALNDLTITEYLSWAAFSFLLSYKSPDRGSEEFTW